jgi:hypothetical protein
VVLAVLWHVRRKSQARGPLDGLECRVVRGISWCGTGFENGLSLETRGRLYSRRRGRGGSSSRVERIAGPESAWTNWWVPYYERGLNISTASIDFCGPRLGSRRACGVDIDDRVSLNVTPRHGDRRSAGCPSSRPGFGPVATSTGAARRVAATPVAMTGRADWSMMSAATRHHERRGKHHPGVPCRCERVVRPSVLPPTLSDLSRSRPASVPDLGPVSTVLLVDHPAMPARMGSGLLSSATLWRGSRSITGS